jgi:cell division protein FtsI/penicillin-binding protein 2
MQTRHYLVRLTCVGAFLLAGYVALALHMYALQVKRHTELYSKAKRKYITSRKEQGQRGRIFDVNGTLLAGNLACRDILAEPRRFTCSRGEIIATLSQELDVEPAVLARRFARALNDKDCVEVVVKTGVDIRVAERIDGYHYRGIRSVDTYCRSYPKGSLMANLVGFLDSDEQGVSGIEALMDEFLQPTSGKAVYERDRKGNRLQRGLLREERARNGADVYVTIQEPIQQIVEEELAAMADKFRPRTAYAVMADPKTGAILAMAQTPTFDPNDRAIMSDPDCWQNRILTEGFEPGSVMKCVSVAGAFDYGTVTLDTMFDCEKGYWVYCRRPLRDSGHRYEWLTVRQIVQKSSNIGTAKIALEMGEARLFQVLTRFGFGKPTGLGFRPPGRQPVLFRQEACGIFRPLHRWDGLSVTRFPIGQGILVTPLQLVQSYCALANGGVMMQLFVVDRVATGDRTLFTRPEPRERCTRPEAVEQVIEAMKLVTQEGGTAPKAAVEGYEVAGKTGTAQKWVSPPNGGGGYYSHSKYTASFIGFVPADDPAFVLLVVADEPSRGGHYGGTIAAPAFSRIAEKTLRYMQIAPTKSAYAEYAPRPAVNDSELAPDIQTIP